ncbi:hypothetical protein [Dyadobacter fanqingshengii]|nr:hypothetical protein [Dyadobacter fanqingshengii]
MQKHVRYKLEWQKRRRKYRTQRKDICEIKNVGINYEKENIKN